VPLIRAAAVNIGTAEARVLAHAIDKSLPVAIEYTNRDGNPSSRVIEQIELSGNSLYAWCRLRDDHRWFTLTRIAGVEPVPDPDG
jgi:predicted DNA-binding transcriptional regulator YafY